ncbi:Bug family tripartite tricarboxylate transporter substrate binding protein [Falsiroseomonas sp. HW251]|uniref:Bug family tripartite tricarboxylate transporter substrate binding protein n=1 Tax=Falsiroseomonas sp. HW251 TaxID=3390998 RepID=UPI003D31E440
MLQRRALVAAAAGMALPSLARAQQQAAPIRFIIPWPPGQAADLAGRVVARFLQEKLNQPVVPENRPGAGGMIGTDFVAKGAPDGTTLLVASSGPVTISPLLQRTPYDAERDFAPVCNFGAAPFVLVTGPNFPASTLAEFITTVRANPDRYSYSSSGTGATAHLISLMFHARAGLKSLHVPFQGSAPGLTAVAGGSVDYSIETWAASAGLVQQGRLRALGISFAEGSSLAPDIPPLARGDGLAGFDIGAWIGLLAPAATPLPLREKLANDVAAILATPEAKERCAAVGLDARPHRLEDFARFLQTQRGAFQAVIQANSIRLD